MVAAEAATPKDLRWFLCCRLAPGQAAVVLLAPPLKVEHHFRGDLYAGLLAAGVAAALASGASGASVASVALGARAAQAALSAAPAPSEGQLQGSFVAAASAALP